MALTTVEELDFVPAGDVFPSPSDWRDQFIYFLMVDRFDDDKDDRQPYDPATAPRGRDPAQGRIFQGGNLRGVSRKLDYIRDLGCTALWLSPIFKNRREKADAYHGYGIQNYLEVDERFGTLEDFRDLVKKAHSMGMYVIQDAVLNHTGDNWAYPGDADNAYNPNGRYDFGFWRGFASPSVEKPFGKDDAVWPTEYQNPEHYKRKGRIMNWDDRDQAINGDFGGMKEIFFSKPDVLDTAIKAHKYWVAATDIDGLRLDAVKHLEDSATAIFCNAIREHAKRIGKANFFIFGEITADDKTIEEYIGANSRIEGTNERFPSMDAALDFPLYNLLEDVIKGFRSPADLKGRYENFRNIYADHGQTSRYFVTFADNHDRNSRFLRATTPEAQALLAAGYLLTSTGIPCLYYGTEQGFNGSGDDFCYVRECMFGGKWGAFDTTEVHFFNQDHPLYRGIRSVADVRAREPALRYGRQYFRETSLDGGSFAYPNSPQSTLAFSRILDTDEILVAMNLDSSSRQDYVTVDRNLIPPGREMEDLLMQGSILTVEDSNGRACLRVPLEGYQMAILKIKSRG